jgi:hypothetical protein
VSKRKHARQPQLRRRTALFAVTVDEEAKEMFVTIQHPAAVVVWAKMAEGQRCSYPHPGRREDAMLAEAQELP